MTVNVTAQNTRLYKTMPGWVKAVYDTGQVDADGNAITVQCHLTQAAVEKQAGTLLPKARIKAILEVELDKVPATVDQEIAAL